MKLFEQTLFVPRRQRWVEDAAPDAQLIDDRHSISFLGTSVGRSRILIFGIISLLFIFALTARVVQLQILQNAEWRTLAEHNRLHVQPIVSERGVIFDRNLIPLVANVPNFRLTIRAQDLPRDEASREQQIRDLGNTIAVPGEKIDKILTAFQKYRYASVVVKEPINYDEAVSVYLKSAAFPSLTIERGAKRNYLAGVPGKQEPLPESFSHLLGYVGRISPDELDAQVGATYFPTDTIGKTGIESMFETALRGIPGERDAEVDAHGAERRTVSVKDPTPGSSVVLSIDYEVQKHLEDALRKGLAISHRTRGSAVAVDPRDGTILALVSLPSYSSNTFADTISPEAYSALLNNSDDPLLNRAVGGQFPSGSTIKPFYAAAALQEGIITPTTTVLSTGGLKIGNRFFPDWKVGGHGVTNVTKAIAESVNTFFYEIGGGYGNQPGLGPAKMKQYLEYFGFGRSTDSGFVGEADGFLQSPAWKQDVRGEQWYPGDTYNMSIGEGDLLITPLQLAMGISAIANDGTLWKPRLELYETQPDGTEVVKKSVVAAKIPIDEKWLKVVQDGMRQTILAGSARSLQQIPLAIAGKTGTAQWSVSKAPHAWFESYAPYDHPEIVTVILIEEGVEGSSTAVPAARDFYTWWAGYRQR